VYLLRCADGTLYIGHTGNLAAREALHNAGHGARYTARRRPVRIVHAEAYDSSQDALARERQLKGWTTRKKEALISGPSHLRGIVKRMRIERG